MMVLPFRSLLLSPSMPQTDLVPVLEPEADVLPLFGPSDARRYRAVPLRRDLRFLVVAMVNAADLSAIEEMEFLTGMPIHAVPSSSVAIESAIARYYSTPAAPVQRSGSEGAPSPEPPLVEIQHLIFSQAMRLGASDIHIDPAERHTRVRFRVDGLMLEPLELPRWLHEKLVARLKVMARLDISEHRLPQDGHLMEPDEGIEGRLSSMPTDRGEAVVVRIFRDRGRLPTIQGLGGGLWVSTQLRAMSQRPQGILIVAGPTGSGKTTTLYAIIDELTASPVNIVTIEDPIEYRLDGIRQIQVDEKSKLTFHRALRSVLRQDPDVILVGEIRDSETAQIAFDAALTGHLVLSTLHATDASSSLLRLEELGVDRYVVRSAMIGAISQRLVRTNCPHCRQPDPAESFYLSRLGIAESDRSRLRRGYGCVECRYTGVAGRDPLFEILEVTGETRDYVAVGSERDLCRAAARSGFVTVLEQAKTRVLAGDIAIEEAYRTCYFGEVV